MLEELRGRFNAIRDRRDDVTLRIHRALSWAEKGLEASEDQDAACIFYWIAFNAMYARKTEEYSERQEQNDFQQFLRRVGNLDSKREVTGVLRDCWEDAKHGLIDNRYVYKGFWTVGGAGAGDPRWKKGFDEEIKQVEAGVRNDDYLPGLRVLFDRLYVLRNQLQHGAATPGSSVNRQQVEAGAAVMARLIPTFIGVIIDNPNADWGRPYFPPVFDAYAIDMPPSM